METPAAKCARLVGALEDLTAQEAGAAAAAAPAAMQQLQRRMAPLVSYLCEHASDAVAPALRRRIAALIQRRTASLAWVSSDVDQIRDQVEELRSKQRRLATMAPMYRRATAAAVRLHAIG